MNPAVAAALITGVSSAIGSWWATRRSEKMANRQSSTAYQRMVRDLNQAGLNPMLAYGQGRGEASLMGQVENPLRGASAVSEAMVAKEQINTMKSQQDLNASNAAKALAEADFTRFSLYKDKVGFVEKERVIGAEILMAYEKAQADLKRAKSEAERSVIETEIASLQRQLTRLMVPEAKFGSERWKYIENLSSPDWMKYIGSFLLGGAGSAARALRDVRGN